MERAPSKIVRARTHDMFCKASAEADCTKTAVCQGKPGCRLFGTSCASSCRETEMCRRAGWCTLKGKDECVVGSNADCAASSRCREEGGCSISEGRCEATNDSDCARSRGCKTFGQCNFLNGSCSLTNAGCEATPGCKLLGKCTIGRLGCEVKGRLDCAKSEVCAKFGWCTPVRPPFSLEDQCAPGQR